MKARPKSSPPSHEGWAFGPMQPGERRIFIHHSKGNANATRRGGAR